MRLRRFCLLLLAAGLISGGAMSAMADEGMAVVEGLVLKTISFSPNIVYVQIDANWGKRPSRVTLPPGEHTLILHYQAADPLGQQRARFTRLCVELVAGRTYRAARNDDGVWIEDTETGEIASDCEQP